MKRREMQRKLAASMESHQEKIYTVETVEEEGMEEGTEIIIY